ncbi:hypothetical protein INT43_006217 [Umbelopsis isabellina]|uniref:CHY-type domain-containing protein n=1 Tax=Mortierella isabellina TaxID=91625 RepID=A0A8H7PZP5_MORIS|nr:hypothetical protein INT43_006217 [Umbelopsis isabellina]
MQATRRTVASRPAPRSSKDARAVELAQLQRRFLSSYMILEQTQDATSVKLDIPPSDPDFPYELEALSIHIRIPADYPKAQCSIQVTNPEISRGFARNLELGFEQHQKSRTSHRTLVQEMTWLDNNMETLLRDPPAPTMRFVSNQTKSSTPSEPPQLLPVQQQQPSALPLSTSATKKPQTVKPSGPRYTHEQLSEASNKREDEIRKLRAKFRNELTELSTRSAESRMLIKLPLDAQCRFQEQLGGSINIEMVIPALYPLDPSHIRLEDTLNVEPWRARSVESGFLKHSLATPTTLFQRLNWLNTNLNLLLDAPKPEEPINAPPIITDAAEARPASPIHDSLPSIRSDAQLDRKDRKLYVAQLPDSAPSVDSPLLKQGNADNNDAIHSHDGSSSAESSDEESDDEEITSKLETTTISTPQPVRTGTEVRFPELKLENVSLLRCARMTIMVKCARCSNTVEVENIIPEQAAVESVNHTSEKYQRWMPCPTCSSLIGILFKGNYLHTNSITLGLLQLASCTPFDLLPSTYIATCTHCLEPHVPMKLTVHDQPKSTACRNCHTKMTIGIPNCQFVRLGSAGSKELKADPNAVLKLKKKKQPKQELGIVVGQALPHHGVCDHYRKSKRWFRFSCCSRIYACDRCHDEKEDHEIEFAKTQICGYCSREFATSKAICACGHEPGKGQKTQFWEGGEGTRNKSMMSRKDRHKYSGSKFKTTSKKQQRVGEAGKKAVENKTKRQNED